MSYTPLLLAVLESAAGFRARGKQRDHHHSPASQSRTRKRVIHGGVHEDRDHPDTPNRIKRRAQTPNKQGYHRNSEREPSVGGPLQPVRVREVGIKTGIDDSS